MLLRYTHHAAERMVEQGITPRMVETALAAPETVIIGETADEYGAPVEDRKMRVVITVYWIFQ